MYLCKGRSDFTIRKSVHREKKNIIKLIHSFSLSKESQDKRVNNTDLYTHTRCIKTFYTTERSATI